MGKLVIALMGVCSLLAGMEDPNTYKNIVDDKSQSLSGLNATGKKKNLSYFSILPDDVGIRTIPHFAAAVKDPRDNRRDYIIERTQNLGNFVNIACDTWEGAIDERPIVDATVKYMQSHPQEESKIRANVLSVTAALPVAQQTMKELLLRRMEQFGSLSQQDKDGVVIDAIKACPDLEVIKPMIECGATVHAHDAGTRGTLLHYASREGDASLVRFLLESKAWVDATDRLESTPLHDAVHAGNLEAATLLLEYKAQVNLWDWAKNNALYYAVLYGDLKMSELLLSHGASIYYSELATEDDANSDDDIYKKNVLARAAAHNSVPLLKLLIEKRGHLQSFLDMLELMVNAALIVAACKGHHEVVDFLLSYADFQKSRPRIMPDSINKDHSAVGYALMHEHYWLAHKLILAGSNEHYSPHCCISRRDSLRIAVEKICQLTPTMHAYKKKYKMLKKIIKIFLKEGIQPATGLRPSAAFIAAKYRNIPLLKRLLKEALKKDLLAPVKLMFDASAAGSAPAVHSLLKVHVLATITDAHGDTPLHKAALILDEHNITLIDYLIAGGADVGARNILKGETPLHRAMKHPNKIEQVTVVKKIVDHLRLKNRVAEVDTPDKHGNTPLMAICSSSKLASNIIQLLIENGAGVNKKNERGQTALFIAALEGSLENVEALLEGGADPNSTNHDGCGPLTKAARNGNHLMITKLLDAGARLPQFKHAMLREAAKGGHLGVMNWLLEQGADINGKSTSYGNTPLHKAVQYQQYDTVDFLLERGADVCAKNLKHNNTPLDTAKALPDQVSAGSIQIWLNKKKNKEKNKALSLTID